MAVGKQHLVDDLLQELADLPTTSKPVAYHATSFISASSSLAARPLPQAQPGKPSAVQQQYQQQQQQWQHQPGDLDSLLNELRDNSMLSQQVQSFEFSSENPNCTSRSAASVSGGTPARLKCSSIYLGGSKDTRGCFQQWQPGPCCCDRLKCLGCDFPVLWHANACWAAGVDYMYFRNGYGVAAQLATQLQPSRGSAAMCCQCSWASCSKVTKLADVAQEAGHRLSWICGGHESQA